MLTFLKLREYEGFFHILGKEPKMLEVVIRMATCGTDYSLSL